MAAGAGGGAPPGDEPLAWPYGKPTTVTGVELVELPLFPNSPSPPYPQHERPPVVFSAHVCSRPPVTAVAFVIPVTVTGELWLVGMVPLPSCPLPAWPQHRTVPVASSAHEWSAPAATATAFVIPLTVTGPLAGFRSSRCRASRRRYCPKQTTGGAVVASPHCVDRCPLRLTWRP